MSGLVEQENTKKYNLGVPTKVKLVCLPRLKKDLTNYIKVSNDNCSFLFGPAECADGVGVDDRSAAARHHRPDAAPRVQDGQLERGPRLGVDVRDVGLLGKGVAAERGRVLDLAPLAAADEVGGRVDLGRNC